MASLSHASFATPNTQQLSPSHKLLPSHLSMDPSSSSLSTLSQHAGELTSWPQKPNAKLSYNQLHSMGSFDNQYGISCPLYEGYSEAGDSIEQGFIGGDEPLLTSSWDALDKLVSASMTSSGSGIGNELPEFMHTSAGHESTLQSTSPSSITAMEEKPLNIWANNQASANNSNNAYGNVGLNLASLISADPGFVERAAKYSCYSQQINQAHNTASLHQSNSNMNNINNAMSLENFNVACARKLSSMNAKALCSNGPLLKRGENVAMELDSNSKISAPKSSNISTPTTLDTKQSISSQGSMGNTSGSKKKREAASCKDGVVDDGRVNVGKKRAKGAERINNDEDTSNATNNFKLRKIFRDDQKTKMQGSNSAESEQKSGGGKEIISKPKGTNGTNNYNVSSSSPGPKPDFIHVRARRGQATDSHSLAERVRREKISERMKYLQDLVPGCTKVTGKAMMLDEIINYVQSLQRQVEFLSMKLAAVHPSKLEFNFETLFGKEVVQQPIVQNNQSVPYAPETHANLKSYPLLHENLQQLQPNHAFPESHLSSCMHTFGSDAALRRTLSMLAAASSETFGDQCISSQMTDAWDEDLQNIVQLGFPETPLNMNPALHGGLLLHGQMKTEI